MRTTLTVEEDNAEGLREMAQRMRRPFKQVVNEVIRTGLRSLTVEETQAPYRVKARPMKLRAGIDPGKLSQFESELDIEKFESTTRRQKTDPS